MPIFNSLGSNYNLRYVSQALFSDPRGQDLKLKTYLQEKYKGKVILTYKGRETLTLALNILNLPKESCVAINGFTCYTVYKSVYKAGLIPICLDLDEKNFDLNFSAESLRKALEKNKNIKAVVVQNTLGYPCGIEEIKRFCSEKNIILIEDLAHCVGTKYANNKEAGTMGDFVTLSFSQDKIIDAVSGGALIIKNKIYRPENNGKAIQQFKNIGSIRRFKDQLYPLFTYKIRLFYGLALGKPLHYLLKTLNLLSSPLAGELYDFYFLPDRHCDLALMELKKLSQQLNHRRQIARIYAKNLNKKILNSNIAEKISISSNLRFPIFVKNRDNLIKFLKKSKIFISDIWYDSVAPECPNAVAISKTIINLPTHINVAKKDALRIAEKINVWLKSQ